MKLYEVPRHTRVRILEDAKTPPASQGLVTGQVLYFDHIDGMYSFCLTAEDGIVHPAAWTEVEIVNE